MRARPLLPLLLLTLPAFPQTTPAFEVASVHLSPANHGFTEQSPSGAREFHVTSVSMLYLLDMAFGVNPNQTANAPGWAGSTLYDLAAKPEGDVGLTYEQLQPLLQTLLKERFHLQAHMERREVPGYALLVAKGGPKLQPAGDTTSATAAIYAEGLSGTGLPMRTLAAMLANPVGSPVIDKTGLPGSYNINLKFASIDNPADPSLPSIFTAITEQLGLRLNREKVSLEFLVVDHVDQLPTAN